MKIITKGLLPSFSSFFGIEHLTIFYPHVSDKDKTLKYVLLGNSANTQSKIASNIKDDCMLVLRKCQESGSDPIGIGEKLRANYPDYWGKTTWLYSYQDMTFNVDVKVHVTSHGLIY